MDILLTHGYFLQEDVHERKVMRPYPPLGILYISAYLKTLGFDVGVLDTTFLSPEAAFSRLKADRPSLVGIYCNMMTKPHVLKMIHFCKQLGATVILGGPEPPSYAQEYLEFGADIIVSGEGEQTLAELIPHVKKNGCAGLEKIPGIAYLDGDGNLQKNGPRPFLQNLDNLPFPDRAAIDLPLYIQTWREHHGTGSVSLIAARGCPYTCTWCSHSVFGFSHRRRSPNNVADEVEHVLATYQPDMLWYADDVFTIHFKWFFDYAKELQRRHIHIPFECISREDRLNEAVIKTLADLGCHRLWIGSESGSQKILDAMQRKTNARRVREMVRLLQRHGIQAGMFIMLGYEGETERDLEETVDHLKEAHPDIFLTTVSYPIKGTKYYREVQKRIGRPGDWQHTTDRDLVIGGRHSRRYYDFANRWLVNEVNREFLAGNGRRHFLQRSKAFLNARIGRLGMHFTRHIKQNGGDRP